MKKILLLPVLAVFFLSCAGSPDAYAPIDENVHTASYDKALASINSEGGQARKKIYTRKNEILFYLDRGMINHYAGFYQDSISDLQTAERLIEEAFTKSISQNAASFIANDNALDYSGEDYEDLYINVFNAINYYHAGDAESALVEIRRLNEKLGFLADKYERAREKLSETENRQVDLSGVPMEASKFSNSALARYLGIVFYRGTGRHDSARVDYDELVRAFSLAPEVYTNPVPLSVHEELSVPPGMGRLNVIAFAGLSPVKMEENFLIPLPFEFPNNTAKIALPVMVDRPSLIQRAELVLDGKAVQLELLEDMGAVARETFKSKYTLTAIKAAARSVIKVTASAAASAVASNRGGALAGLAVGVGGRLVAGASEQADTRMARYIPRYAFVGGLNLEPGIYSATVNYYGSGGLIHSENRNITVNSNSVNLLNFSHLASGAADGNTADRGVIAQGKGPAPVPVSSVSNRPDDTPSDSQQHGQNILVVVPLQNRIGNEYNADVATITELLMNAIVRTNRFEVVERSMFENKMKEHGFQMEDWPGDSRAAEMGKAMDANFVVRGQIIRLGSSMILSATLLNTDRGRIVNSSEMQLHGIEEAYGKMAAFVQPLTSNVRIAAAPMQVSPPPEAQPAIPEQPETAETPPSDPRPPQAEKTIPVDTGQDNTQVGKHRITALNPDKLIFGININPSGFLLSGPSICFELGKKYFNFEWHIFFPTLDLFNTVDFKWALGWLFTFNYFWHNRIGGFYLGFGLGFFGGNFPERIYDYDENGNRTGRWVDGQLNITVGVNLGYKFVTSSGIYFRTGGYIGPKFTNYYNKGTYVYFRPDLSVGYKFLGRRSK